MQEIGLQELIDQVRKELLVRQHEDPIFFLEKVELELAVKVVRAANGGVKVTVIGIVEGNVGGSLGGEQGHTVKITLSPLIERQEILAEVLKDPNRKDLLMKYMGIAFTKSDTAGQI